MQLIRDGQFVPDRWIRATAEGTLSCGTEVGFEVDPDTPMNRLQHLAKQAALLVGEEQARLSKWSFDERKREMHSPRTSNPVEQ